ncbi:9944_t:CDS:2, partial [Dentiscutata erythropus]
ESEKHTKIRLKVLAGMNNMNRLRPPFPPRMVARDIVTVISNESSERLKAFHVYRIYLRKNAGSQNIILPNNILSLASSRFWAQEPRHVKEMYQESAAK